MGLLLICLSRTHLEKRAWFVGTHLFRSLRIIFSAIPAAPHYSDCQTTSFFFIPKQVYLWGVLTPLKNEKPMAVLDVLAGWFCSSIGVSFGWMILQLHSFVSPYVSVCQMPNRQRRLALCPSLCLLSPTRLCVSEALARWFCGSVVICLPVLSARCLGWMVLPQTGLHVSGFSANRFTCEGFFTPFRTFIVAWLC